MRSRPAGWSRSGGTALRALRTPRWPQEHRQDGTQRSDEKGPAPRPAQTPAITHGSSDRSGLAPTRSGPGPGSWIFPNGHRFESTFHIDYSCLTLNPRHGNVVRRSWPEAVTRCAGRATGRASHLVDVHPEGRDAAGADRDDVHRAAGAGQRLQSRLAWSGHVSDAGGGGCWARGERPAGWGRMSMKMSSGLGLRHQVSVDVAERLLQGFWRRTCGTVRRRVHRAGPGRKAA